MSRRRFLVLALAVFFPVVAVLGAYLAYSWPYARKPSALPPARPYDGTEPPSCGSAGCPASSFISTRRPGAHPAGPRDGSLGARGDRLVPPHRQAGGHLRRRRRQRGLLHRDRLTAGRGQGRVYAFEPDPTNFAILRKNVELNGLTNVVLEQKALTNKKAL